MGDGGHDALTVTTRTFGNAIEYIPLALVAILLRGPALALGAHFGGLANLVALFVLGVVGALVYGAALVGALRLLGVSLPALRLRRAS